MFGDLTVGSNATYTCNSGFELIGDAVTTCTELSRDMLEFQPAPPFCRREYKCKLPGVVMCHLLVTCVNLLDIEEPPKYLCAKRVVSFKIATTKLCSQTMQSSCSLVISLGPCR